MADLSRLVELVFGVRREGEDAIDSLVRDLNSVESTVTGVTQPLADFTGALVKVEAAALATGAALVAMAVKTAGDFDTNFRLITTLIEDSDSSLGGFRDQILDYGRTSTQSIEAINSALQVAIGQGIDYSNSLGIISVAEKASVANRAELDDSTRLLVSTLNAYGLATGDAATVTANATKVSDVFFKTIADGNITVADLADGFSNVAPLGAQLQIPLETLGAALAVMTQAGIPASEAITSLKSVLEAIIAPSEQAKKLAADLGIEFDAQAVKSKGLEGVLFDMATATGLNEEQMFKLLGRSEALKGALTLLGPLADNFRAELDKMGDAAGATDAAFAKMAESTDLILTKLTNSVKLLLINVGDPLLNEFGDVAEAIRQIFLALGDSVSDGNLKQIVDFLESRLGALADTLATVATNLPAALESADLSGFINGLKVLENAFETVFGAVDLTTVEGLRSAIEKIGKSFELLSTFSAGAIEGVGPFIDKLGDIGNAILEIDPDMIKLAGNIGGAASAVNLIVPLVNSLAIGILAVGGNLPALLAGLATLALRVTALGAIAGVTYQLGRWADLNDRLIPGVDTVGTKIYELVNGVNGATESLSELNKSLEESRKRALELADGFAVPFKEGDLADLLGSMDQQLQLATEGFDELGAGVKRADEVLNKLQGSGEKATETLQTIDDQGLKPLDSSINTASGGFIQMGDRMAQIQKDGTGLTLTFDEMGNVVTKSLSNIGDSTSTLAQKADEAAKKSNDFLLSWLELQSQERVQLFEIKADVDKAELEAAAKSFEAAFASIAAGFESSGNILSSALDQLSAFANVNTSFNDAFDLLERSIDREFDIREQLVDSQSSLNDALADFFLQRAEAARRGESEIKISTEGLSPALELVMFEIAERMRVAVTADEGDFLLAVGGGA